MARIVVEAPGIEGGRTTCAAVCSREPSYAFFEGIARSWVGRRAVTRANPVGGYSSVVEGKTRGARVAGERGRGVLGMGCWSRWVVRAQAGRLPGSVENVCRRDTFPLAIESSEATSRLGRHVHGVTRHACTAQGK
jgi:hypothetical protein